MRASPDKGIRRLAAVLLLFAVSVAVATAAPAPLTDDFSTYPVGSSGEPGWKPLDLGFAVREAAPGKEMTAEAPGGSGILLWQAAPVARRIMLEATVTPRQTAGNGWKTAGIGLWLNGENFWHLSFVEAPDTQGRNHYLELSEMLDGQWNAQNTLPSRLTTAEDSGSFAWRFGQPYRLRLSLERDRLVGEVFEGETRRYRCVLLLDRRAVSFGRPMLSAGHFTAAFTAVRADVGEAADPREVAKATATAAPPSFHWGTAAGTASARHDGFFRTRRTGQTWWFVDPHEQPMLAIGTDHVNYNAHWCEKLGYAPYHRQVEAKYGGEAAWSKEETRRLRAWHFNTLGAGCSRSARYQGLAHTEFLSFGMDFSATAALVPKTDWTGWPDVFDPRWERFCEIRAAERCEPNRGDPWLIGYFLDNELEWWGKQGRPWGLAQEAWRLPGARAGKQALVASLRRTYATDLAAFNTDFGTSFKSFDDLGPAQAPAEPLTARGRDALMGFVREAAQRYFQVTSAAVRRHDPNHLLLGCRFAYDAPPAAWQAAGQTCDVVTVNIYPRIDLQRAQVVGLDDHLRSRFALCGKPIMLTEWSFPALDARDAQGHPIPSQHGAGMRVDTQEQKARCYAIMQRALFALPFVVGSDYFMWADEPALGISSTFPEDSNYGLVSESDQPYAELVATAARVNAQMAALHTGTIRRPPAAPAATAFPPAAPAATAFPPAPLASTPETRPAFERNSNGYTLQNGRLRLEKDQADGDAFDHIYWREGARGAWIELGRYGPLIVQVAAGQTRWVHPDRVSATQVRAQGARLALDITFEKDAASLEDGAQPFRCCYRITIDAGRPYFLAQCLWVENSGAKALGWHGYFHYTPSNLGGEAKDDVVDGPNVPDYWLSFGAWRDPALQLDYGVLPVNSDDRLRIAFWKDQSGQHPDCYRELDGQLKPGERWQPAGPEPLVAVFGLREPGDGPHPWLGPIQSLRAQIAGGPAFPVHAALRKAVELGRQKKARLAAGLLLIRF